MSYHSHPDQHPAQTKGRLIRWASAYDGLVYLLSFGQIRRLREMTVTLAQINPGDSVLDVGCGTGAVTIPAKIRTGPGGLAAGIDPAPEMIATARRKAASKNLEIDFRVGVIEALPYPDMSIDVVTSSLMLHHLPLDLQVRGLAEVYRVLKPGGRLLIADFMRPSASLFGHVCAAFSIHRGMRFGIDDLPELLRTSQFSQVSVLKERFLVIGFIRAIK